jgi:hypothetical protein
MTGKKLITWGVFCLLAASSARLWGGDARTAPIDLYLIIDSSSAMERGKEAALSWLCTAIVDGILQQGDTIKIWTAGEKPELIYSDESGNDKEAAKKAIRSIRFGGESADYRGSLQEVRNRVRGGRRIAYTLLVSGSQAKDPPSREAESAGLLRYSRVDHFSGWRVLTVGFDLDARVQRGSAYYMSRQ